MDTITVLMLSLMVSIGIWGLIGIILEVLFKKSNNIFGLLGGLISFILCITIPLFEFYETTTTHNYKIISPYTNSTNEFVVDFSYNEGYGNPYYGLYKTNNKRKTYTKLNSGRTKIYVVDTINTPLLVQKVTFRYMTYFGMQTKVKKALENKLYFTKSVELNLNNGHVQ